MRARRRGWAAVLLAGASGVAAVAPVLLVTAQPAFAFAQKVEMKPNQQGTNYYFSPATATIAPGDKIIWLNNSNTKHTVTSDQGAQDFDYTIGPGREEELRFEKAGTYTYHCTIHPNMRGTIEVADPTTTTTAKPTTTTTPPPPPPPPTTATAPPTTTTTAPATTTTSEPRPAAGPPAGPLPPVPNTAAAPPPVSSSTTAPPTTTTTAAPTTDTSAPPALAGGDEGAAPPPASAPPTPQPSAAPPPSTEEPTGVAAGLPARSSHDVDKTAVALVVALVLVGAFGGWTLIRVRPGRI